MNYDLHTHTTFSDGKNTVSEMVFASEAMGLDYIAITDHYFEPYVGWVDEMIKEVKKVQDKFSVKVLKGVEATTLDMKGEISITLEIDSKLDLVLVDFLGDRIEGVNLHVENLTKEELIENFTTCLVNVVGNPLVDIVAHPFNFGRWLGKVSLNDFSIQNLMKIAAAFNENNTSFEIMNNIWWWWPEVNPRKFREEYVKILKIFHKEGVKFSMGSDAHSVGAVGNLGWVREIIKEIGINKERIVNPERFLKRGG